MNPPRVVVNAKPPKEWFEIVGRGLERHNTAATGNVEYHPVGHTHYLLSKRLRVS